MKLPMHPDMIEATRLTHNGRLTEATAPQRMLQSGMELDARADGMAAGSPPAGAAPIIELTPEVIEVSAPRPSAPTGSAEADLDGSQPSKSAMARMPMPDWLRGSSRSEDRPRKRVAAGGNRRLFVGRHSRQDARRLDHELERGRRTPARVYRVRDDRSLGAIPHSALAAKRGARHSGCHPDGRAHRPLRDGSAPQERSGYRRVSHDLAHPRPRRPRERRLEHRARHHRA